ncbi:lysophospholipase [Luteimonas chenhongjianii]|uniref:Lysophospholipase n=1 Tax=Luteimonas chenhongjianii TaxID=2006110 RepID=A0A290XBZ7_9GAMM|nr:SGNH/GDSL hydrolase family protein [Luteimonas chenhongjianii]ATD66675.1 lysophospholipase [Luteimonas chenhongjianii]
MRPARYLALGDSYTIGEGIAPEDRWPVRVADALRATGIALDEPEIIATTGWTTDELDAGIDAAAPQGPFDLVSLLIGVNDQYRGRDVASYRPAFSALLERAIGFAGDDPARVFVLAIPDWGVTPFGAHSGRDVDAIARELDAYNAAAQAICAARGVAFVDIAPVSRARGGEVEMLADDGLHPSAALHAEWTRLALPVARGLLSRA